MQSTIYFLQQQLKLAKETIAKLSKPDSTDHTKAEEESFAVREETKIVEETIKDDTMDQSVKEHSENSNNNESEPCTSVRNFFL